MLSGDLRYHPASTELYTACEGNASIRKHCFPPMGQFARQEKYGGEILVIDPTTSKATSLHLSGFLRPWITHGVDPFRSPDGNPLTIFDVNHLTNLAHTPGSTAEPKAASPTEGFIHTVSSTTATWVRSVRHPLIRTPNDIFHRRQRQHRAIQVP